LIKQCQIKEQKKQITNEILK